jgi:hypothetical protein
MNEDCPKPNPTFSFFGGHLGNFDQKCDFEIWRNWPASRHWMFQHGGLTLNDAYDPGKAFGERKFAARSTWVGARGRLLVLRYPISKSIFPSLN